MTDDTFLPFERPAVCRKKVTAAFDGGLISSDGGLVLLREAEHRLGLADLLAGCLRDRRDPALVTHTLAEMLRFRMLAVACDYEDVYCIRDQAENLIKMHKVQLASDHTSWRPCGMGVFLVEKGQAPGAANFNPERFGTDGLGACVGALDAGKEGNERGILVMAGALERSCIPVRSALTGWRRSRPVPAFGTAALMRRPR